MPVPALSVDHVALRIYDAAATPFREEDHGAQKSIYFEDPNGITLEITTPDSKRATLPDAGAQQLVRRWISEG